MPAEASPFSARRSGGVRHPPETDIESIRDLLRGYDESRSILKELIQNAEIVQIGHQFKNKEDGAHRRGPSRTLRTATEGALRFGPQRL